MPDSSLLPAHTFAGHTLCSADAPGVRLVETSYTPGQVLRKHAHERAHFCLVVHGDYTESCDSNEHHRGASSLAYLPAGVAHSESHRRNGLHFILELAPQFADGMKGPASQTDVTQRSAVLIAARLHAHVRMEHRIDEARCLDLAWELLAFLYIAPPRPTRWLERARVAIHDQYTGRVRLSSLATDAGVHPVYLAQQFRSVFGYTIGDYVRQLRVDHARRELAGGQAPISEIALDAGFSDQSHLSRHFTRAMGTTPAAYRRAVGRRRVP